MASDPLSNWSCLGFSVFSQFPQTGPIFVEGFSKKKPKELSNRPYYFLIGGIERSY